MSYLMYSARGRLRGERGAMSGSYIKAVIVLEEDRPLTSVDGRSEALGLDHEVQIFLSWLGGQLAQRFGGFWRCFFILEWYFFFFSERTSASVMAEGPLARNLNVKLRLTKENVLRRTLEVQDLRGFTEHFGKIYELC
ncbi:hypothetical protein TIFTF001_043550 [Ficus carica]|uniref:Uncharacterized protein n=1 Tax=Ficus carica TaxID=3494 RepID=A0AA88CLS9_FICCA|nr:hypothetical protein TIFTF001_043550 [Ficus carica]